MSEKKIGFFTGSASATNVERLISNLETMLSGEYQLDLITTSPENFTEAALNGYTVFGGGYRQSFIGGAKALNRYLKTTNPSVVMQITQPPLHGSIVGALSKRFGTPSVYRYSGDRFYIHTEMSGVERMKKFVLNNIIGYGVVHLAHRHIVLGPTGKQRLVNRGVDPSSVSIIPPAIDVSKFREAEEVDISNANMNIPHSRKIVLFLGRLHRLKGTETLERLIPEILSRRSDIQFVFLGENYHFTVPPGLEEHVTLMGHVEPECVPRYLQWADVMIHPSLTEGVPRAVLESLAVGTPVIARDVGEVASVTNNTFITDKEFINMVCDFEKLPVDSIAQFNIDEVKNDYQEFFSDYI
jgi:glycosyltransferase involved in cell wall biosynthesis